MREIVFLAWGVPASTAPLVTPTVI